ncbi:MAG: hypothetical protein M3R25_02895 [Bacteroidota bacterium]|nr:hypothetical protein [Bacteroidota bacterium]
MAKQAKKKTIKSVSRPEAVSPKKIAKTGMPADIPAEPQPLWHAYAAYGVTILFFILSLIGILHHEMWRDEFQAWMVAGDAHSIPQLFKNLKYEGNPVLWHAFLYVITSVTENPFWMQIFHILISTSFIFLINRYAPFSLLQKVLLTFGYYTFFEFNLISRSYGLGFLLVVVFCVLYQQRQKYLIWMGAVLFLLANCTIFGVILAVTFSGVVVLEYLLQSKKVKGEKIRIGPLAGFLGLALLGVILGYMQIHPEPDNSFPTYYVNFYDSLRTQWTMSRLLHAYFAIPDFTNYNWWNTNFFVPQEDRFIIAIGPVLLLMWVLAFMRYRLILALYVVGTFTILAFHYYSGLMWSRYASHLFVVLVACFWLMRYYTGTAYSWQPLKMLALIGDKIRTPLWYIVLGTSLVGGVVSFILDLQRPFSTSQEAANYLKENKLDQLEIIGSTDYVVSPLVTHLGRKIYYPERKEKGSFIIYDPQRLNLWSFDAIQNMALELNETGQKKIILIRSTPIQMTYEDTGESVPWTEGNLTDWLVMTLIHKVEPGIVSDEKYFIYSIDEVAGR